MDQPVLAITTAAVRGELRQGNPFSTTKSILKMSSFEREGWWRIALTSIQLSPGQYEILPAPVPKHASSSKIPNRLFHSS
ncbi:protein STPG4 isoform X4 [Tamandua tetradactyla]|uniref:protein STPG4 isoform X4 n=1 Tax=Tamandua tetradactyla TaxID=48850 RepID=UPI004053DD56